MVAMATYIFHRHIMRKLKTDIFFCLDGDIWNLFLQQCLLSSPLRFIWLLSKSNNLIGYQGDKRVFFSNHLKNHKVNEAVTFHTCLWHYPLHKLYFCFGQVRTLVGMATFSLLWLYLANSQVSAYRTIGPLVYKML